MKRLAARHEAARSRYRACVDELNVRELRRLAVMVGTRNAGHWTRERLLTALGGTPGRDRF